MARSIGARDLEGHALNTLGATLAAAGETLDAPVILIKNETEYEPMESIQFLFEDCHDVDNGSTPASWPVI